MGKKLDLEGKRFDKWHVVSYLKGSRNKPAAWLCRCECGVERPVQTGNLVSGGSTGCYRCSRDKLKKEQIVYKDYWQSIVRNAIRRGIECSATKEEIEELLIKQDYKCALTGLPIYMSRNAMEHRGGYTTASIDRKNPGVGYHIDNLQWIHKIVNIQKNALSNEEYIQVCKLVADNNITNSKDISWINSRRATRNDLSKENYRGTYRSARKFNATN